MVDNLIDRQWRLLNQDRMMDDVGTPETTQINWEQSS